MFGAALPAPLPRPRGLADLRGLVEGALLAQRGHLLPWVPVTLGTGIATYLALSVEPGLLAWSLVALGTGLIVWGARAAGPALAPLLVALVLVVAGAGLAALRTQAVAAPVLGFRYYGPVEGRIVEVDRSASDALRLTLDRVVLERMDPGRTPARVRISLHGEQRWLRAEPGRVVMMTAHLSPPPGPSEPGGFDFRRTAWFERLGAVGYTRTPVLTRAPPPTGIWGGLWLHRLRAHLSAGVQALIPGDSGGLAAAVTTGDRSGLSLAANEAMRDSGLYHVVSISGLHMGMLSAFVFGLVRIGVSLVPPLALRVDARKAAATIALPVAAFYLALAGRDVATERAFLMVAVMLGAILLDRRAVTLRSVAVAALVVMALRPEAVANAGFQMSFAAVTALTWAFGTRRSDRLSRRWPWLAPVVLMLLSSLVAGLATAPYMGAHFNRVAQFSLLANLLATPAMGILIMPGAVLMALGALVGLPQPGALLMDLGCRWTLLVAEWVAGMDGATSGLKAPPALVLPLVTAGGLVLMLWQGRGRWAGTGVLGLAGLLWVLAERPALLVAPSGTMIGVMTAEGRAPSRGTGDGFTVEAWLERDGDLAPQEVAARRGAFAAEGRLLRAEVQGTTVLLARGSRALAEIEGCGGADLLVTDQEAGERPCLVLDLLRLRDTGAVAGWPGGDGLRLVTVAETAGRRPWTGAG